MTQREITDHGNGFTSKPWGPDLVEVFYGTMRITNTTPDKVQAVIDRFWARMSRD